ncbi:MAG: ATP-binding protein [Proteobacteria bacterium]|nr:ATP-binding protein [Pseudomonadota bacterium]
MTQNSHYNNQKTGVFATTAPLTNVSMCSKALLRAVDRPFHLPGFVCFYGPSGWGKSTAATYVANTQNAYYIQCMETWTRKAVLLAILQIMGIPPEKTMYEMVEQICRQLSSSGRPLIVDEFDHIVKREAVEMIRDIYEGSRAAILLIGEELLPDKLKRWERFHGRVLDWVPAQPADFDDCQHLASLYVQDLDIAVDLLQAIHVASRGSARRIIVNLSLVQEHAANLGLDAIDRSEWGNRKFYTGEPPERRIVR